MTKIREKEWRNITNQSLKIERWIERGTKAWGNFHNKDKGMRDFPYQEQRLGKALLILSHRASRLNVPYKGWWNQREVLISSPADTQLHPPIFYTLLLTMSSVSSSGSNRMRTVRRHMLKGTRGVTPFIFNKNDYQVSPFLSSYLINRLMIIVFLYRSLWAVSVGRLILRSDRYPSSGGEVWWPL